MEDRKKVTKSRLYKQQIWCDVDNLHTNWNERNIQTVFTSNLDKPVYNKTEIGCLHYC